MVDTPEARASSSSSSNSSLHRTPRSSGDAPLSRGLGAAATTIPPLARRPGLPAPGGDDAHGMTVAGVRERIPELDLAPGHRPRVQCVEIAAEGEVGAVPRDAAEHERRRGRRALRIAPLPGWMRPVMYIEWP